MIDLLFDFDARELVDGLGALPGHLEDAVLGAVLRSTEAIATEAKANHPYRNRTGNLEAETRSDHPSGRFMDDTMRGAAIAGMPYATFVRDRGYAFLEPAAAAMEPEMSRYLEDALVLAVLRSGLAP